MHVKCLWKLEEDYNSEFELLSNNISFIIGLLKVSPEKLLCFLHSFFPAYFLGPLPSLDQQPCFTGYCLKNKTKKKKQLVMWVKKVFL